MKSTNSKVVATKKEKEKCWLLRKGCFQDVEAAIDKSWSGNTGVEMCKSL
jgi:hypothetical protein